MYNVCKIELRLSTIHFFLQFRLSNGVVAKMNALIIIKINEKSSQEMFFFVENMSR